MREDPHLKCAHIVIACVVNYIREITVYETGILISVLVICQAVTQIELHFSLPLIDYQHIYCSKIVLNIQIYKNVYLLTLQ